MGRIYKQRHPSPVSTPGTEVLASNYHYPIKEPGLLGEIVDSKAGENRKEPEYLVVPDSKEVCS